MLRQNRLCDSGDNALCPAARGIDEYESKSIEMPELRTLSESCSPWRRCVQMNYQDSVEEGRLELLTLSCVLCPVSSVLCLGSVKWLSRLRYETPTLRYL